MKLKRPEVSPPDPWWVTPVVIAVAFLACVALSVPFYFAAKAYAAMVAGIVAPHDALARP